VHKFYYNKQKMGAHKWLADAGVFKARTYMYAKYLDPLIK
jgi:hypothetical protein